MTIAQPTSSFTPSVVAGLVKLTLPLLSDLDVATPSFKGLAGRIGVSRNTGYTMAEEIRDAIQHLPRPKGRPAKQEPDVSNDVRVVLLKATLKYLQDHPGAMVPKARRHHYSDGFRRFIVDLYQEHREQVSLTALPIMLDCLSTQFEAGCGIAPTKRTQRLRTMILLPSNGASSPW